MQSIRISLLLAAALSAAPASAKKASDHAEPLHAAYALLDKGDYAHAYPAFLRQSGKNPLAQFMLGLFHQIGWGRPVDQDAACAWFAKAARGKIPTAQHYSATCLMRTPDVPGNAGAALAEYLAAAEGGHKISLCSAAEFYIRGRYVARDVVRGLNLCGQAAMANSPPAMLLLAKYLQNDPDVPRDLAGARHWYQLAAGHNVPEARYQLAIMQSQGDGGPVDSSAALGNMEALAAAGYAAAYLPTAVLYAHQPPQADTGAPSAEHLAKAYLWASAAKASLADPAPAEKLLASVLALMPAEWRPGLDRKVADHLAKFAAPRATGASPGA
ncbi:tetratricopeptide repeat protein [Pseudoduganella sp. R-32]|uniref:tetratricopeptide repeat protein n=1 Tax=Pseudoduganella sp. R-32 TaxID=3404061 RepID=UPI003CE89A7E